MIKKKIRQDMLIGCFSFIILTYSLFLWQIRSDILFTDRLFQPKFDRSYETVSVVVGKRALLPCYVSLQDVKNNGSGSFKVIIIYIYISSKKKERNM
jgi:hypothetical protein